MLVSVAPARQRASTRVTEPPVVEPNVVDSLEISHEGDSRYALKCFAVASTARAFDRYEVNADKANPRDG